ncbi:sulfur oxidation c-type cytochrome SoxX [Roseateles puraquae]|jgi:L-cysteine S-thiosulfotransferase|uniref:Sulfur oxidation c-type cytochrome SoxX n=1 Tax=Roseateles puraquae TaxID=431059 RepID=A0A254N340_9BURK|nr:sulfur oxidation c-type cytochrome SoxX [Roseateles puraquae]MDG0857005.1 sulfur oxidation c-type cytochrome SoxX [Roseateles puraquae]OWR00550.1 sulfur oxidation c-type cytochrome SoxX [Roseateles puraquae]
MKIRYLTAMTLIAATGAHAQTAKQLDQQADAMMRASFREQGIAKLDRLNQDDAQRACSQAKPPSAAVTKKIEAAQMATIKWPADGQYIGDWKEGEKLAQNGRGMTWTDASAAPAKNGAMCYNCHQIDKKEISFGTIGPSLWNYGKLRGVTDPADPAAAAIVKYTWGKLYNSKAYSACSNMPRFGHAELLNEQQIRDVMALLLDPKSPVNQ